ncbi:integrase [Streptomyces sp. NPDC001228]|uniref:integrase n=1 Tax=Streptomyces sp. NPDC001228 TaxID=3154381 RepID=UPI003319CF3F
MAEWRLFWVGGGGTPSAGAESPLGHWGDLASRERALGLREGLPILVSPDGRIDPRLSAVLRHREFAGKAEGTWATYAPCFRVFFTFLWRRGRNWDRATSADLEDWEDWRLRGEGNPALIVGSTWKKELAALQLLYGIARKLQFVTVSPVVTRPVVLPGRGVVESPELAPGDVRTSCVKWLTPRAFRLWRDVGLGGLGPDGLERPDWPGRNDGRDMAFADFVYSCGLRRREAGTVLLVEVPETGVSSYYAGWVGRAVAKRAGRYYYVSHSALRGTEVYRASTRRVSVRRAQQAGLYERVLGRRVVEEVGRGRRVRWSEADGRLREGSLDELTARQRMRMFVRGPEGLEPAMLWLTEAGMPMAYRSWTKTFERASERCAAAGVKVFATPKMLRHSMALRVLVSLHHALDRRLGLSPSQRRLYEDAYGSVWTVMKDLLGHRSEETTREIYLEPVRGLQIETLLEDVDNPGSSEVLARLAERTGLVLDVA